ncbi:MAG: ThiF family adenylyltransferase [Planctomycetota bacterium]
MTTATRDLTAQDLFQRSLTAHLPLPQFERLRRTTVLVAGLGGGSNIAELLARKGIGRFIVADPDVYEPHNIRQRGSLVSTQGRGKVEVMVERLRDVNPGVEVTPVPEGITFDNVAELVRQADYVVDMVDFHGLREKVALSRAARAQGKVVLTAPSIVNGGLLYVFRPDGVTFEEFFEYEEGLPMAEIGPRFLRRLIPRFPSDAPREMYLAAARGERTLPLDAVGVEQASVLLVAALENLVLGRPERVVFVPKGVLVDASDPVFLAAVVDYTADFPSQRR